LRYNNNMPNNDNHKNKDEISKDHVAILLEGLKSDFKIFGESLAAVREKGEATFEEVGHLREDVNVLKTDVAELKTDVSVLKTDMQTVKEELHLIRNELKEKVSREEFVFLETRVTQLERLARR